MCHSREWQFFHYWLSNYTQNLILAFEFLNIPILDKLKLMSYFNIITLLLKTNIKVHVTF